MPQTATKAAVESLVIIEYHYCTGFDVQIRCEAGLLGGRWLCSSSTSSKAGSFFVGGLKDVDEYVNAAWLVQSRAPLDPVKRFGDVGRARGVGED